MLRQHPNPSTVQHLERRCRQLVATDAASTAAMRCCSLNELRLAAQRAPLPPQHTPYSARQNGRCPHTAHMGVRLCRLSRALCRRSYHQAPPFNSSPPGFSKPRRPFQTTAAAHSIPTAAKPHPQLPGYHQPPPQPDRPGLSPRASTPIIISLISSNSHPGAALSAQDCHHRQQ